MITLLNRKSVSIVIFSLLLLISGISLAQVCTGGSGTTGVLKTITIDGDPSDWTEVLTSQQVTFDDYGSYSDCTASNDLDCPVGNTGRDINTFAWTYDAKYIYIYQTRYDSTTNAQEFMFSMDVNGNQRMESTDRVLRVTFLNSTVNARLYVYEPVDTTNGDPMVDTNGFADGYDMVGGITANSPLVDYTDPGFPIAGMGLIDGTGFEVRVPWCDLSPTCGGCPIPTDPSYPPDCSPVAIFFHIAGANGTTPNKVVDNAGNPDGGIGYFGFYSIDISPDHSSTIATTDALEHVVTYTHTITNELPSSEILNIHVTSTSGFSVDLYDASGPTLMATDSNGDGDFSDTGDYVNPTYDTEGTPNGFPDTGTLAPFGTFDLEIQITVPPYTSAVIEKTSVWVDVYGESIDDCALDTTTIGDILVEPDLNQSGAPTKYVDFNHTVEHFIAQDYINLSAISSSGWRIDFYDSSDNLMATDLNGDGDFADPGESVDPLYDGDIDGYPDTGFLAASPSSFSFYTRVTLPALNPGTFDLGDIDTITVTGQSTLTNNYAFDTAIDTLTARNEIEINPDYTGAQAKRGAAGTTVYFPHVIINSDTDTDNAELSVPVLTQNGSTVTWTVEFWTDPNCDGNISDGALITGTPPTTSLLNPFGGTLCIVAGLQIPSGAIQGASVIMNIQADSVLGGATDTAIDHLSIGSLISCKDVACAELSSFFAHCEPIFIKGFNHVVNTNYTLNYDTYASHAVQADAFGNIDDSYTIQTGNPAGVWNIYDSLASINITVEPTVAGTNTISPFRTVRLRVPDPANVSINATLNNNNAGGDYLDTYSNSVIVDTAHTQYWNGTIFDTPYGDWTDWTRTAMNIDVLAQASYLDSFTLNGVDFPNPGVWEIRGMWTACSGGYEVARASNTFLVGTTLATYQSDYTTSQTSFTYGSTVYLAGDYYYPHDGTYPTQDDMVIAYYGCGGKRITTSSPISTDASGRVEFGQDTSTWQRVGAVTAVLYPEGFTPPANYNASDVNILGSTTFTITITAGPDESACLNDPAFNLSGQAPTGGTWSGTGITNANLGTFDPATAGEGGPYTITYTYTDADGCIAQATKNVTVLGLPAATADNGGPYCEGQTIELFGGPDNMDYSWTGPNGFTSTDQNPTIPGATSANAGLYTLTVTDTLGNGCSAQATTTVSMGGSVSATATNGGPYCVGDTIQLTGAPDGMASYGWTGPDGFSSALQNPTVPATLAAAGTYTLTVTDGSGCTGQDTTDVLVNTPPVAAASNGGPYCEGDTIQLTGAPDSMAIYAWTGPNGFTSDQQSPTLAATLLAAGTYTLTVTDTNGCTGQDTTDVVVNATPVATASNGGPYCEGETIQLTGGPDGMTTYAWTGPNGFTSSEQSPAIASATTAEAGVYTLTVTDANGCSDAETTAVSVYTVMTVDATPDGTSSACVDENITFNVFASGGSGIYGLQWQEDGGDLAGKTGEAAWNTGATGLIDNDPAGASFALNGFTIASPADLAELYYTLGGTTDLLNCVRIELEAPTLDRLVVKDYGVAAASPFDITGFYNTYGPGDYNLIVLELSGCDTGSADISDIFMGVNHKLTLTYSTPQSHAYNCLISDLGTTSGCATSDLTSNTGEWTQPTATATNGGPYCEGDTIQLTGAPDGMTTYAWTGPNGYTSSEQSPSILSATVAMAGDYTLTVTDGDGCTNQDTTTVVVNAAPVATATNGGPYCVGDTIQLTGAPDGMAIYAWTGPDGFSSALQNPTVPATLAAAGTYTLTITDGSGCTGQDTTDVVVNTPPVAAASNGGPYCEGDTIQLTGAPDSMAIYAWTGPDGFTSDQQSPTLAATLAAAGTYTLTVTDTNGCTGQDTTDVVVNAAPVATASNGGPYCEGETIQLTGGPDGMTTYAWTGPNGFTSSEQSPAIASATTAEAGVYTLTVTDANGCSDAETTTVSVYTVMTVDATPDGTSSACVDENITFNVFASGGSGIYGLQWQEDGGDLAGKTGEAAWNTGATGLIDNDPAGASFALNGFTIASPADLAELYYTLGGTTDLLNCVRIELEAPTLDRLVVKDYGVAAASPFDITGFYNTYGPGDYNLIVLELSGCDTGSADISDIFMGVNHKLTLTYSTPQSHAYNCLISDLGTTSGCATSDLTSNTGEWTQPTATATNGGPYCEGDTIQLTGAPDGMTTYAWTGPNGYTSSEQSPSILSATVAMAGDYTLTVTDGDGCTNQDTTTVVVNTAPVASASNGGPYCEGQTIELTGGPDGMSSYAWTGPNGYTSSEQSPSILSSTTAMAGVYTLTVTNADGCTDDATTSVTVDIGVTATASNTGPYCEGDTIQLNGSPDSMASYAWTGPNGFTSSEQNPSIPAATAAMGGDYTLTATNSGGCTGQDTTTVVVNTPPTAAASNGGPYCEGDTIDLTGEPDSMASYAWTGPNGFTSSLQSPTIADATSAAAGVYTLTVTDANGCTDQTTTSVTVNASPTATASNTGPVCEGFPVQLIGGPAGMSSYSWTGPNGYTSSLQSPTILVTTSSHNGVYTLTVTNAAGCTDQAQTTVTVNAPPAVTASNNGPVCEGGILQLTGGPAGMSIYSWVGPNGYTSSQQSPQIVGITLAQAGSYSLTVTDSNGCIASTSTTVIVNALPAVDAGSNDNVCINTPPYNMTGFSPAGGVWSGTGITNPGLGTFNPAVAGAGIHTLTYTIFDGTCFNADTKNVRVSDPVATATNTGAYCEGETIELFGGPDGMVSYHWTGPNGFDSFDRNPTIVGASTANSGTYLLTVEDGYGCSDSETTSVTVVTGVSVDVTPNATTSTCYDEYLDFIVRATGGTGIYTTQWQEDGSDMPGEAGEAAWRAGQAGIVDNDLSGGQAFTLNGFTIAPPADIARVYYILGGTTDLLNCVRIELEAPNLDRIVLKDYGVPSAAPYDITLFYNDPAHGPGNYKLYIFELSGCGGGGVADISDIFMSVNTVLSVTHSGAETHTYNCLVTDRGTASGACFNMDPLASTGQWYYTTTEAGADEITWLGADPFNLSGASPASGIWSGTGITNGSLGTFSPTLAGVGTFVITYTFTDVHGCVTSDTKTVRVDDVWLLRNDDAATLTFAEIFNFRPYPGDPGLNPGRDLEKAQFLSNDPFPNETNDLDPGAEPLIFYELTKGLDTVMVTKSGGKVVITYN